VQTFGIFAAGYLIRPLGGIVLAHFGDLLGRKKMFVLSVMLMSVPTLAIGLLPTYASIGVAAPVLLLLMRLLQGAAVAGEVPGAWVFVSEHVPKRYVNFACGTLTSGLTAGILVGSFVATWIHGSYSPAQVADFAWRIPFLAGGAFGVVSVYLRTWLAETPVFHEIKRRKHLSADLPVKAVLRDHPRATVIAMLLTCTLAAGMITIVLMMPTLMQKNFHVPAHDALVGNSIAVIALTIGCSLFGWLADRFGQRTVLQFGAVFLAVSFYAFYTQVMRTPDPSSWLLLYALTGLALGVVGVIPGAIVSSFPAKVRFTGISFSYNVAYAVFGGLTPIVLSLGIVATPFAPIYLIAAVCALGAVAVTAIRRLTQVAEAEDAAAMR
jgi:MFS family permease